MVTKEQLKDWLNESGRNRYEEELERVFDREIKRNALKGNNTFLISTGRVNNEKRTHEKTPFYHVWHTDKLSKENRDVVKRRLLQRYRDAGFHVAVVNEDCGWHSSYDAVEFTDIHKAIEGETEWRK